jgi:hypothetical protein
MKINITFDFDEIQIEMLKTHPCSSTDEKFKYEYTEDETLDLIDDIKEKLLQAVAKREEDNISENNINWVRVEELLKEMGAISPTDDDSKVVSMFSDADYELIKSVITLQDYERYSITDTPDNYDSIDEYKFSLIHSFLRCMLVADVLEFRYGHEETKSILSVLDGNFQ